MDSAIQTMIDNMPEKTGKSLVEWKAILETKNFAKHGDAMKFLKGEHKVTHGFANMIIQLSKKSNESDIDLVSTQYIGKESLIPIYESLIKTCKSLGDDIKITPKKSSVSIIRKRQFLLIKPATKSRIDLGLKLKDQEVDGILENSGPFGSMCTHRIRISSLEDVNEEVVQWIKLAFEQSI